MKCKDCIEKRYELCLFCKQMQSITQWEYEIDNGQRMCKCPSCGGRLYLGPYTYVNPYKFCPYCGRKN